MGRIGSVGPPLLLDLFNSSLAIALATCARGASGSGDGYLTVEAIEASLEGRCALGVAIVSSSGLALLDLDFSRGRTGGAGGGAGGGGG